jgi:hypothetical protein
LVAEAAPLDDAPVPDAGTTPGVVIPEPMPFPVTAGEDWPATDGAPGVGEDSMLGPAELELLANGAAVLVVGWLGAGGRRTVVPPTTMTAPVLDAEDDPTCPEPDIGIEARLVTRAL